MRLRNTAILLTVSSCRLMAAASADNPRLPVTLRVLNESGAERRVLDAAKREANAILGRAGIHLIWLACERDYTTQALPGPCQTDHGPFEFWVLIGSRKPAARSDEMLGFTEIDDAIGMRSSLIYYPAAVRLAQDLRMNTAAILGAAIAHEVGHLILGSGCHSASGLMSPRWDKSHFKLIDVGGLGFSDRQARLLRAEIAARMAVGRKQPSLAPESLPALWRIVGLPSVI